MNDKDIKPVLCTLGRPQHAHILVGEQSVQSLVAHRPETVERKACRPFSEEHRAEGDGVEWRDLSEIVHLKKKNSSC